MTVSRLSDRTPIAYINAEGQLPEEFQGKVGVYAISNDDRIVQYIGYSRDVFLSLKQHLIRQPLSCGFVQVETIDRPSRTILDEISQAWIEEINLPTIATVKSESPWTEPIDVKPQLTEDEKTQLEKAIDDISKVGILKKACRRVEATILETLKTRGLQTEIRFNPKLKEVGLLDLK
jgi:hypothetical protein